MGETSVLERKGKRVRYQKEWEEAERGAGKEVDDFMKEYRNNFEHYTGKLGSEYQPANVKRELSGIAKVKPKAVGDLKGELDFGLSSEADFKVLLDKIKKLKKAS